jgi:hypothetical protein
MFDDVIQNDAIKRHFREPDVFQGTQVRVNSKGLTRTGHSVGIYILTMDIPSQCPQASEARAVTTANVE